MLKLAKSLITIESWQVPTTRTVLLVWESSVLRALLIVFRVQSTVTVRAVTGIVSGPKHRMDKSTANGLLLKWCIKLGMRALLYGTSFFKSGADWTEPTEHMPLNS